MDLVNSELVAAFGRARRRDVVCAAQVMNTIATAADDFEKGERRHLPPA